MTVDAVSQVADGIQAASLNGSGKAKPRLVLCASPAAGHAGPILRIAAELGKRGYPLTFVTGEEFREEIERIGGELFTVPPMFGPGVLEARSKVPPGFGRVMFDMENIFVKTIPERWRGLTEALETVRERNPSEEVLVVSEPFFGGINPLIFGAPLPKGFESRPKVLGLGICAYLAYSIDVGPGGPGLPPDSSESGRARNQLLEMLLVNGPLAPSIALEAELMKNLGATEFVPGSLITNWFHAPDWTLQLTPPSIEYPRSDLPASVKFIGTLPASPPRPGFVFPSWWDEVTKSDRKVVMVTQGTVQLEYTDLIIPTIKALADRDDVYVVAVLGQKGAALPKDVAIPANTRVIDYLSYDAILPHTNVFVSNAGYGGFLHGITNGVPMVMAGQTEDKPEVSMRGEWSGVAVNLRTGTPTVEQLQEGINKILTNESYKQKVVAVQKENEGLHALEQVEKYIIQLTGA